MNQQFIFKYEGNNYDVGYEKFNIGLLSFKVTVPDGLLPKAFNPFKFSVQKLPNGELKLKNILDFIEDDPIQNKIAKFICELEGIV